MDEHERERPDEELSDPLSGESDGLSGDPLSREPDGLDGEPRSGAPERLDVGDLRGEDAGLGPLEHGAGEDEPELDDEPDEEDEDDETLESVTVEVTGLSLYTHHGVSAAEREIGQRLVLDLRLELGEAGATATDRIDDTVDYGEVCQLVALIAQQRSYRTLERLCSSIADRLLADYALDGVWVKAAKPEPPIPLPVDEVSVEVWREPAE